MKIQRLATSLLTLVLLMQSAILPSVAQSTRAEKAPTAITSADSQTNLYSISGQVTDGSGNGIAGVTVTVTSTHSGKYPIIVIPGVLGTQLRNDIAAGSECSNRPAGRLWVQKDKLSSLEPLCLNEEGTNSRNACNDIQPDGRMNMRVPVDFFQSSRSI